MIFLEITILGMFFSQEEGGANGTRLRKMYQLCGVIKFPNTPWFGD